MLRRAARARSSPTNCQPGTGMWVETWVNQGLSSNYWKYMANRRRDASPSRVETCKDGKVEGVSCNPEIFREKKGCPPGPVSEVGMQRRNGFGDGTTAARPIRAGGPAPPERCLQSGALADPQRHRRRGRGPGGLSAGLSILRRLRGREPQSLAAPHTAPA